jgi:Cys-rich repeat protein
MYRRTLFVGLIALCSMAATGCHLYLDDEDDDGYSYCDDTGCYDCDEWGCWPDGGVGGTGWDCDSDYDCAAGCYCDPDTDTCQEGGFCRDDDDCAEGFVCDNRSSCVPDDQEPEECTEDADCPDGSFCDESSGECVDSSGCVLDEDCPDGQTCDEERNTCVPAPCDENSDCPTGSYCDQSSGECVGSSVCGENGECPEGTTCDEETNTCVPDQPPPATCQGEVTCDEAPPECPDGTNPGIVDGCYNGECIADEDCPDGAPITCEDHDEDACLADATCETIYRGINCTDPTPNDDIPCSDEADDCICERYVFHECVPAEEPAP